MVVVIAAAGGEEVLIIVVVIVVEVVIVMCLLKLVLEKLKLRLFNNLEASCIARKSINILIKPSRAEEKSNPPDLWRNLQTLQ